MTGRTERMFEFYAPDALIRDALPDRGAAREIRGQRLGNARTQHIDALQHAFILHVKGIDVEVPARALQLETGFQAEFDIGDLFLSAYLIGTEIGTLAGGGRCGELTSRGYAACGIGAFKQRRVWRAWIGRASCRERVCQY